MMSWWNRKHKLAVRTSCLKRSFKGFRNSTLVGGKTELGFWMEGNEVERRRFLVRALRLRSEGDKLGIKVNGWEHSPLQWRRSVFEHSHSHLARFLVITHVQLKLQVATTAATFRSHKPVEGRWTVAGAWQRHPPRFLSLPLSISRVCGFRF